jgi:pilus assembly protein Flp/PilA
VPCALLTILEGNTLMLAYLRKVSRQARDRGASAVEYGLMVAAIAAVIVGVVFGLGTLVRGAFSKTCGAISASANVGGTC